MDTKELDLVVSRLVKVGIVTDINDQEVRVYFDIEDMTSGWLPVLRGNYKVDDNTAEFVMPKVNDTVVVLYLPFADSDGFVIGGIPT